MPMYVIYVQEFEMWALFFPVMRSVRLNWWSDRADHMPRVGWLHLALCRDRWGLGLDAAAIISTGWSCGSMFNRLFLGTSSSWDTWGASRYEGPASWAVV